MYQNIPFRRIKAASAALPPEQSNEPDPVICLRKLGGQDHPEDAVLNCAPLVAQLVEALTKPDDSAPAGNDPVAEQMQPLAEEPTPAGEASELDEPSFG